ncbi:hypothetical protein A9Q84_06170 [Halobacteriovorax marinus]|uniref:Uncharacterized protein n=1 Tax=Halobacteriovorax marinus TaxID=97084 RepID=A0A1Y5FDK3_9BACT|nr:hypothetical protein A9Q84_06170 [Halobacteriovorax marinus]
MKEYQPIDTPAQKEALINEFKGNLFEYLVGQLLSRHYKIEADFTRSFGGEIRSQLTHYDHWLRVHEPDLVRQLPILAQTVIKSLIDFLPEKVSKIFVIGKSAGGSHNKSWDEADLLVQSFDLLIPISIKLCKSHAFVNTKSAGIKSFISNYFSSFSEATYFQNIINEGVERRFENMALELHEKAGIEFFGRFDHRWTDAGHSELPGQLPRDYNEIVVKTYYECIKDIYESFLNFKKSNEVEFIKSLLPLIGLSNPEIIQVTCFHSESGGKKYIPKGVHLLDGKSLDGKNTSIEILKLKDNISSFEMQLFGLRLQVRVKPMNKFTSAAFKVNCSIKEIT